MPYSRKDSTKNRSESPKNEERSKILPFPDLVKNTDENIFRKPNPISSRSKSTEISTAAKRTSTVFGKKLICQIFLENKL